jgi:hypothetical protein
MNTQLLLSIGIIFAAFAFWVVIQESARRFAKRHPEFGPAREEGGECGISCSCANWKTCRDRACAETKCDRADPPERSDG